MDGSQVAKDLLVACSCGDGWSREEGGVGFPLAIIELLWMDGLKCKVRLYKAI